jgi:hypothetical protein
MGGRRDGEDGVIFGAGTTAECWVGVIGCVRGRRRGVVAANLAQPLTSSTKAAPSRNKDDKDGATSQQAWPRRLGLC